jgi:hypothetical protein
MVLSMAWQNLIMAAKPKEHIILHILIESYNFKSPTFWEPEEFSSASHEKDKSCVGTVISACQVGKAPWGSSDRIVNHLKFCIS